MTGKLRGVLTTGALLLAAAAAYLQLSACGGSGTTATTGTLKVALTDKLSDNFSQVVVKVKEVRVVPAGLEDAADNDPGLPVIATFANPPSIDVLTLGFQQQLLGTAVIPAGSYNQLRLILEPNPSGQGQEPVNYVVLKSDPTAAKIPLKTPSAQQSGLKVLGSFEVKAGAISAIVVDFDPNTAIVDTGSSDKNQKFILKPTGIRIIQLADTLSSYGSFSGTIAAATAWSSATVSVVPQGQTGSIATGAVFGNFTSGAYKAPFTAQVPAGTYRLHVRASGFTPYSSPLTPVTQGADSPLGTITLKPATP